MVPARRSSQYFHTSEPEPSTWPCQLPRSIGPAGTKIAGRPALVAPMQQRRRGLVAAAHQHDAIDRMASASAPPRPSPACCGRAWCVGLTKLSDSDSAGSSIGKPPACSTPRFTSSTRCLKCAWQGLMSDQVLRMAMTGLPRPILRVVAHLHGAGAWPDPRRSSGANQRALRSSLPPCVTRTFGASSSNFIALAKLHTARRFMEGFDKLLKMFTL